MVREPGLLCVACLGEDALLGVLVVGETGLLGELRVLHGAGLGHALVGAVGLQGPVGVGVLPLRIGLVGCGADADALLGDIAGKCSAFAFPLGGVAVAVEKLGGHGGLAEAKATGGGSCSGGLGGVSLLLGGE